MSGEFFSHPRPSRAWSLRARQFSLAILAVGCTLSGAQATTTAHDAVARKLSSLKGNHAVLLGKPNVSGDFNQTALDYKLHLTGPLARDYSVKMLWAPERKRALFAGANHGVPHRLNDVWEFDLATLTWILLYPPDNPRSYLGLGKDPSDVEFRDGILMTKRGGPAIIAHTWWQFTYDTDLHRFLFMNNWVVNQDRIVKEIGGDPSQRYKGPALWAFYPGSGRWELLKTYRPWPGEPFSAMLEYIPTKRAALFHSNNWQQRSTWMFSPDTRKWVNTNANADTKDFATQSPQPGQVGYYDPKRNIVVAQSKRGTFHYSLDSNTWSKRTEADSDDRAPYGLDKQSGFFFDPLSAQGLFIELTSGALWAYDPDRVKWHRLSPQGDPLPAGARRLAFLDMARNVLVVIQADAVWAYRYRTP